LSDFGLRWSDTQRWELQIDYHGRLFAAIAMQLMLVVADADTLYCCSGCGYPYFRARDRKCPKPGCANYCQPCVDKGVPKRESD
jgi:hypothetical protein